MQTLARAVAVNLELRRALLRAREMALTDALTGLPNRRAMMIALSQALVTGNDTAVISVDPDHFKEANDAEGTEIVQRISATLHRPVARGTKLLRLGATLGVAVAPADAREPELVMRVADEAMVRRAACPRRLRHRQLRAAATAAAAPRRVETRQAVRPATKHG